MLRTLPVALVLVLIGALVQPASAVCVDDVFEDNDSLADPAAVGEGTINSLRSCLADDDFFSILLSAGEEVTVEVAFSHAEGDIQLELLDASGTLLASSTTATDNERIVQAPGAGIFVIRVFACTPYLAC